MSEAAFVSNAPPKRVLSATMVAPEAMVGANMAEITGLASRAPVPSLGMQQHQEFVVLTLSITEAISVVSSLAWEFTFRPTIEFSFLLTIPEYFKEDQTKDLASVMSQLGDPEADHFMLSRIIELISDARNQIVSLPMCRAFSLRNCGHADELYSLLRRYSDFYSSAVAFKLRLRFRALNQPASLPSAMLIRRIAATLIDHAVAHALEPLAVVPMQFYRQVEDKIRNRLAETLMTSVTSCSFAHDEFDTLNFMDDPKEQTESSELSILFELGATIDRSTAMVEEQEKRHQMKLELLQSAMSENQSDHQKNAGTSNCKPLLKISVATSPRSPTEQESSLASSLEMFLQKGAFSQLTIEKLTDEIKQMQAQVIAAQQECDTHRAAAEAANFRADSMQRAAASAWGFAMNPSSPAHRGVPSGSDSWRSNSSVGSNGSAPNNYR